MTQPLKTSRTKGRTESKQGSSFPPAAPLLAPLAAWFENARRQMPWRAENLDIPHPDPYAVLVSELMLQQTQVATVIPYFERWMQRFPDAATLAMAGEDEVHRYWEGLGYYRRARHLQAAAAAITRSGWPAELEGLMALPGLGPYTAAALASIAFQQPEAALDGNAFRVLARLLGLREDPRTYAATLRTWLHPALEVHGPSRVTQGIMELGALICQPAPRCGGCPLHAACAARHLDLTDAIPPRIPRPAAKEIQLHLVALEAEGSWLLHPPAQKGLLAGLWRWPSVEHPEPQADLAAEARAPYAGPSGTTWPGWTQVYSHRKEHVIPVAMHLARRPAAPEGLRWITPEELQQIPMGKRDQRMRSLLKEPGTQTETIPLDWLLGT
jgi:A/G-specific adenine glycosylase